MVCPKLKDCSDKMSKEQFEFFCINRSHLCPKNVVRKTPKEWMGKKKC